MTGELVKTVNHLLDYKRESLGLKSDAELALNLHISPMTITRWRKGELGKAVRTLVSIAWELHTEEEAA